MAETMLEIGVGKFLTASIYQGQLQLHCRYWEKDVVTAKPYPTKKGVYFGPVVFANLMSIADEVTAELRDDALTTTTTGGDEPYRKHIGSGIYLEVRKPRPIVDLRHYFKPKNGYELKPTRRGINLSATEWQELLNCAQTIREEYPEYKEAVPNICAGFHFDQLATNCDYCHPFKSDAGAKMEAEPSQ